MNDVSLSKFLSLVLRHEPQRVGLTLDQAGWVPVDALISGCANHGVVLTRSRLETIVAQSEKQRFAFDSSRSMIRANQGHSIQVDLGYEAQTPPEILYHGTVDKFLPAIRAQGLIKGARHHVHLSPDEATAHKVGSRRGSPVVLAVAAGTMHRSGVTFFRSTNGVWLVDHVPANYIHFP